jgi:hypothetical protein
LNTDLSVAPEIAQLAAPLLPVQQDVSAPRTDGRIAGDLAALAAAPQRWWDLVRFDPAGEAVKFTAGGTGNGTGRPLRPGRVRVHGAASSQAPGAPHRLRTAGHGYSVTLHTGA